MKLLGAYCSLVTSNVSVYVRFNVLDSIILLKMRACVSATGTCAVITLERTTNQSNYVIRST